MKRIGTFWRTAMLLALCLLFALNQANAQGESDTTPELSRDWTVRLGVWIPQSKSVRNVNGEVGISGLLERRVYDGVSYEILVGIGYNGFDRIYNIPLMLSILAKRGSFRYGVGGGYSFGKRVDSSGTQGAALGVILGYQLTHNRTPISGDLRYYFISGSDNELDGFSLTLGVKF